MVDWNTILDFVTIAFVAAGAYALHLVKGATRAAVKTTAEETAKATVKEPQWPMELAGELQKTTRGVERQEVRYQSHGAPWERLRPLAIYDETVLIRATAGKKEIRQIAGAGRVSTPSNDSQCFSKLEAYFERASLPIWRVGFGDR